MTNFYTVEKEINGKTYKAQFNGIGAALEAIDSSYIDGTNNVSMTKLSNYLFKYVLVEPKGMTANDFDNMAEFNEVIGFLREVMEGSFREEKDNSTAKEKSK